MKDFRVGDWLVTKGYIEFLDNGYEIHLGHLSEMDWLRHLRAKHWFSKSVERDFLEACFYALTETKPEEKDDKQQVLGLRVFSENTEHLPQ